MSIKNIKNNNIKERLKNFNNFITITKIKPIIKLKENNNEIEQTEIFIEPVKKNNKNTTKSILGKEKFDFENLIKISKLTYIKSGSTGQTFRGDVIINNKLFSYGIKICGYPKSEYYGNPNNIERPENAELRMLKVLSYFIINKKTPHITLPYGIFDTNIKYFIEDNEYTKTANSTLYNKFVKNYKEGKLHSTVSVLICEWANKGDFLDFIRNNYSEITPIMWKVFFFQILSVLAVIQKKYPMFKHNDLKANNVLIHEIISSSKKKERKDIYNISGNEFIVPKIKYILKIWDFDFSCISGIVENKKVGHGWSKSMNITCEQNRYYDVHYFFNTLLYFFNKKVTTIFPKEVLKFINSILPERLVKGKFIDTIGLFKKKNKNGDVIGTSKNEEIDVCYEKKRLLKNEEYITPLEILTTNNYFEEFRTKKNVENSDYVLNVSKLSKYKI